jgi:hypothetical protein
MKTPLFYFIDGTIGADYVRKLLSTNIRSLVKTRTAGIGIIYLARNKPIGRLDIFDNKDDIRRVSRSKFGRRSIYDPTLFRRDEGKTLKIS